MTPNLKKKTAVKVDKKDKFCWNEVNSSCNGGFTVNKKKKRGRDKTTNADET